MKTTIVPAQITTVEDKVTGSLSLSQLILLTAPIFVGIAVYVAFPPVLHNSIIKTLLVMVFAVTCSLFAIRIKGQILLFWAIIVLRYNVRPRYYIYDKNDLYLRIKPKLMPEPAVEQADEPAVEDATATEPQMTLADIVKLEHIIADPAANLHFKTDRKGALNVIITEVKQ